MEFVCGHRACGTIGLLKFGVISGSETVVNLVSTVVKVKNALALRSVAPIKNLLRELGFLHTPQIASS